MTKVCYISDFLLEDLIGGTELNDDQLCKMLINYGFSLTRNRSSQIKLQDIHLDVFYIISNFCNLKEEVKHYIQENCNYVIYEHDHKYLISRDPSLYDRYRAPTDHIINRTFYQRAKKVFCQSSFHCNIIKENLKLNNLHNVSGNLWSDSSLHLMKILSDSPKQDRYSILNSHIKHKSTQETIFYCQSKGYKYDVLSSDDYEDFLSLLSNNKKFIFVPKTPETLSRVVVEAKMMNVEVTVNKKIGASYEPWYALNGIELIKEMKRCKVRTLETMVDLIKVTDD